MPFPSVVAVVLTSAAIGLPPGAEPDPATDAAKAKPGAADPQPAARPAPAKFKVGKRALAKAYIDLERLMVDNAETASPETIVSVNRAFDAATDAFFIGDYSTAVRMMHDQQRKLFSGRIGPVLDHYDIQLDRWYIPVGTTSEIKVRVVSMYASELRPDPKTATLGATCSMGGGQVPFTLPDADGSATEASLFIMPRHVGECSLTFGDRGMGVPVGQPIWATSVSLDRLKQDYLRRINAMPNAHEELRQAITTCRSRIDLLSDSPGEARSAEFLIPFDRLAFDLKREIETLEHGQDPYIGFNGDQWLTFTVGGTQVPMRLHVPERPSSEYELPRPLIIALHGAGGDESLWAVGYGGGIMATLSQREGFILCTPAVTMASAGEGFFDALVETVAKWQPVDRSKVYVVGHSMGGGIASAWAKARPDKVAAVCTIAGIGQFKGAKKLPPTLVIAGELDPLITPAQVKQDADEAVKQGLPVEYRAIKNYGHTLVVAKAAQEVVDWCLRQKLPEKPEEQPAAKPQDKP